MPLPECLIHEVEILARVQGLEMLTVDQEVGGSESTQLYQNKRVSGPETWVTERT